MKKKDNSDLYQKLKQFLDGGDIKDGGVILPYWLSTPDALGYGFIQISVKPDKDQRFSSILIEELIYSEEEMGGKKIECVYHHDEAYEDVGKFSEDPFSYLEFDEQGKTRRRALNFLWHYQLMGRGQGLYGGLMEDHRGGICLRIAQALEKEMKIVGSFEYQPNHLYVYGDIKKVNKILEKIRAFVNAKIYKDGKYPCVCISY